MRPLKGDAGSPAPSAGPAGQVLRQALPVCLPRRSGSAAPSWTRRPLRAPRAFPWPGSVVCAPAHCGLVAAALQPKHGHDSGDLLGFQVAAVALPEAGPSAL